MRLFRFLGFVLAPVPRVAEWVQIVIGLLILGGAGFLSEFELSLPWFAFPLGILIVLLAIAGYRLYREKELSFQPRLQFDDYLYQRRPPFVVKSVMKVGEDGRVSEPENRLEKAPEVVLTKVRNDPPQRRPGARVKDAQITLGFFSLPDWSLAVSSRGMWLENDPPVFGRSLDSIRRRDLPANGTQHEIELLVKHPGNGGCYASDPELHLSKDMRNERFSLTGEYAVALRISGENLPSDVVKWYLLKNLADGRIQITVAPADFTQGVPG